MFDRSWTGYSCSPLVEHLIVFAIVFAAGYTWAVALHWYIEYRLETDAHA